MLVVLGLIAAMSVGGVALASGTSRAARVRPPAATVVHPQLQQTLQQAIQQFLAQPPLGRQLQLLSGRPPVLVAPNGGTCFVSGCSETPCVIPVQASTPVAVAVAVGGAVAEPLRVRPASRARAAPRPAARVQTAIIPQRLQNQSCPGGQVRPQTLRVSGP